MLCKQTVILLSVICFISCMSQKPDKMISDTDTTAIDLSTAAINFSKQVFGENLRVIYHDRAESNYFDVQMLFEADDFESDHFTGYTSYSNKLVPNKSWDSNYDGFILFEVIFKDSDSAKHAFDIIKSITEIRFSELEGLAGLLVEQIQIFERIRHNGGMFTQKEEHLFYLLKTCDNPPYGNDWNAYENMFLSLITTENEVIEVVNIDCGDKEFVISNKIALR